MTRIYIMSGPSGGAFYDIEDDTIQIGRSSRNRIQIRDKYISRRHLKIIRENKGYLVRDMDSKNGTFVDGVQIDAGIDVAVGEGLPIVIGMSLICLGKECSESILAFLDSFEGLEKEAEGDTIHQVEDRPMTLRKNQELIKKVSDVFMESSDVDEILEKILEYILDVLKRVDRSFILMFDSKSAEVTHMATRLRTGVEGKGVNYSQAVVQQVRLEGKGLMIADASGQERIDYTTTLDLEKIKSVMCVPILFGSQIGGVIYVDSLSRPHGFRQEDLSLLTSLSSRAAFSIQSALAYASQKETL